MKWSRLAIVAVALSSASVPALAQVGGFDGPDFFRALRGRESGKAAELLKARPGLINARDEKGETALLIVVARRDQEWMDYLLAKGADPNIGARNGDTPLIAAARIGNLDAVQQLLGAKARIDGANRMGETPLIIAVQQRQIPVIKFLLQHGADPDKTDSAAGYSARDYAKRDNRGGEMLRLIEARKPTPISSATR